MMTPAVLVLSPCSSENALLNGTLCKISWCKIRTHSSFHYCELSCASEAVWVYGMSCYIAGNSRSSLWNAEIHVVACLKYGWSVFHSIGIELSWHPCEWLGEFAGELFAWNSGCTHHRWISSHLSRQRRTVVTLL